MPRKMIGGKLLVSFREMWKITADPMIKDRQAAAWADKAGWIRETEGRVSPSAANTSEVPMKRTMASGILKTQGIHSNKSRMGCVTFR
ncbi:MAG: hypothetical protein JWO30_246 [Fibrobacteres bacterium]|nr:hypothetical protein [Fibrobacterota bacterium]